MARSWPRHKVLNFLPPPAPSPQYTIIIDGKRRGLSKRLIIIINCWDVELAEVNSSQHAKPQGMVDVYRSKPLKSHPFPIPSHTHTHTHTHETYILILYMLHAYVHVQYVHKVKYPQGNSPK